MTIRVITPIADILALQRFPSTYMRVGILVRPTGKRLTRMSFVRFCCASIQPTLSGIVAAQGRDLSDRCVAGPLASQRFPRREIVTREDVSRHVWGVVVTYRGRCSGHRRRSGSRVGDHAARNRTFPLARCTSRYTSANVRCVRRFRRSGSGLRPQKHTCTPAWDPPR